MSQGSRARILLVDDVSLEAKLLLRTLTDAGYSNVIYKSDVSGALAEFTNNPPRIVLTDFELGQLSGADLTRKIRQLSRDEYTYVVMLTSHGGGPKLTAAFEAGADDFVTKPYRPEELLARVRAGLRVVDLETRLRRKSVELETALRRVDVAAAQRALALAASQAAEDEAEAGNSVEAIAATNTWKTADETCIKLLSDFFQTPFTVASMPAMPAAPFVATILLSDPARELEISISVLVDKPSERALALQLLGDDDPDSAQALILEVSNLIMGGLKAKLSAAGYGFVGGIPQTSSIEAARQDLESTPVRLRSTLTTKDASVHVWIRASAKGNARLRVAALREGMILGSDVKTITGMLLLRGGSRLTMSAIERLKTTLSPEIEVEVSVANAA